MVCHALERHGSAIGVKLDEKPCGKENFDRKWRMTVYGWLKVKLLYYTSVLNQLSTAFYSLAICASVLEILFFL